MEVRRQMKNSIAVIGAGSMGLAVSKLLVDNGNSVVVWSPFKEEADSINIERKHSKIEALDIPEEIYCTTDMKEAVEGKEVCILVVPSHTIRSTAEKLKPYITDGMIIGCFSKGLEEETGLRLSEVVTEVIPNCKFVAMSGPCHAEELIKKLPAAYVAASEYMDAAEKLQDLFMSDSFRVYTSSDVIGAEIGGALKNVIALCAGISDGLGYGDNTKAALMTRGMAEMTRLGVAVGAKAETFSGLTGMGDLIVTCTSMHSRNRRAGILIGQGKSAEEAIEEIQMVVEGVRTTQAAYDLAKKYNVEMPIVFAAHKLLFENGNTKEVVLGLMTRDKKGEEE